MCRFRPVIFFPRVEAALAAHLGGLRALTVDDGSARLGVPPGAHPHGLAQGGVDPFPGAVERPFVEVIPDAVIIREVLGQHRPLTARPCEVQDGVDDLTKVQFTRATRALLRGKQRLDKLPLRVGQIGRIPPSRTRPRHSAPSVICVRRRYMANYSIGTIFLKFPLRNSPQALVRLGPVSQRSPPKLSQGLTVPALSPASGEARTPHYADPWAGGSTAWATAVSLS